MEYWRHTNNAKNTNTEFQTETTRRNNKVTNVMMSIFGAILSTILLTVFIMILVGLIQESNHNKIASQQMRREFAGIEKKSSKLQMKLVHQYNRE